jgi:hypothetical protein
MSSKPSVKSSTVDMAGEVCNYNVFNFSKVNHRFRQFLEEVNCILNEKALIEIMFGFFAPFSFSELLRNYNAAQKKQHHDSEMTCYLSYLNAVIREALSFPKDRAAFDSDMCRCVFPTCASGANDLPVLFVLSELMIGFAKIDIHCDAELEVLITALFPDVLRLEENRQSIHRRKHSHPSLAQSLRAMPLRYTMNTSLCRQVSMSLTKTKAEALNTVDFLEQFELMEPVPTKSCSFCSELFECNERTDLCSFDCLTKFVQLIQNYEQGAQVPDSRIVEYFTARRDASGFGNIRKLRAFIRDRQKKLDE